MSYLSDLAAEGYVICTPLGAPLWTIEETGRVVVEWQDPRLAVVLSAEVADGLADAVADARRKEAEAEIDDSGLWPSP